MGHLSAAVWGLPTAPEDCSPEPNPAVACGPGRGDLGVGLSRTSLRYGGVALAGTIALGCLMSQPGALATQASIPGSAEGSVLTQAIASLEMQKAHTAQQPAPVAAKASVVVPALTVLSIPDLSAAATSQGYALRDVLVDASPDRDDRDFTFVLQLHDGADWVEAATGSTTGAADQTVLANLPAGTYRVVLPRQFGMDEFVGEPFTHQPRQLSAGASFSAGNVRTSVDVNPDGASYTFTLERKSGDTWQGIGDHTSDAAGGFTFDDLPTGTYRVVVPDQADSIGTVSNEVSVTSAADQRAAAVRAAAAQRERSAAGASSRSSTSGAPAAPGVDAPASAGGGSIVGTGLAQVGDRYVRGGNGPNAFDCSGLTSYAYRAAGISIPRTAAAQYRASTKVSNPQPGDLVFFLNGAEHVGIYIGGGRMVHAATPGRGVEITSINSGWYSRTFTGYGRF